MLSKLPFLELVIDNNKNILRLISLVLDIKMNDINNKKKNELVKIIIDYQYSKLEIIKLILFIFSKYCEEPDINSIKISEFIDSTRLNAPKNISNIRKNITALKSLKIEYYNNNGKLVEELLFKNLYYKKGKISYNINSFFKSKLSEKNGVHQHFELPADFMVDNDYRNHYQSCVRLLLIIFYINDYQKLLNVSDEKRVLYFKDIVFNYFYKYYNPFTNDYYIKINEFCKKIIKLC